MVIKYHSSKIKLTCCIGTSIGVALAVRLLMELLLILTIVVVSVRTATPDAILNLDVFFSEKGDGGGGRREVLDEQTDGTDIPYSI